MNCSYSCILGVTFYTLFDKLLSSLLVYCMQDFFFTAKICQPASKKLIDCVFVYRDVKFLPDCVGKEVEEACQNPIPGIV